MRHTLPRYLKSDRGSQFINELVEKLLEKLGIKRFKILPYSPQSNGIIERSNRETLKHLKCLTYDLGKTHAQWDEVLPITQHIINHSVNSSTGFSPHTLLYGHTATDVLLDRLEEAVSVTTQDLRELEGEQAHYATRRQRQSLLQKFPELINEVTISKSTAEAYLTGLQAHLQDIRMRAARTQMHRIEVRNKSRNKGAEERKFDLGDFVILLDVEKANKMQPTGLGPYKVIKAHPEAQGYVIESIVNPGKTHDVHARHLLKLQYAEEDLELIRNVARRDESEEEVYEILGHEYEQQGKIRQLKLRIRWKSGEVTLEPWLNARGNDKAEEYMREHALKRRAEL